MDFIVNAATDHPFLTGGIATAILWYIVNQFSDLPSKIYRKIKSHFFVSLYIAERDSAFEWVAEWVSTLDFIDHVKDLELVTSWPNENNDDDDFYEVSRHRRHEKILGFLPAMGTHYFKYKGYHTWLHAEKSKKTDGEVTQGGFTLTVLGTDPQLLRDLVDEIVSVQRNKHDNLVKIYIPKYEDWAVLKKVHPRFLNTVILPKGQAEELEADIINFQNNREMYRELNIPYRRGYLFHGIAGTGKTSIVMAVASQLDMNICILNLSDIPTDKHLSVILAKTPPNSIVLIEDIDAFFTKRIRAKNVKITFSGLLNALDGLMSPEGIITCMTSNYVGKLDNALIRSGRVDYKLEFTWSDEDQQRRMFKRFYPSASIEDENKFIDLLKGKNIAISDIQFLLVSSNFDINKLFQLTEAYKERVEEIDISDELDEKSDEDEDEEKLSEEPEIFDDY
jgi:mitochondrial chaperone BCS1